MKKNIKLLSLFTILILIAGLSGQSFAGRKRGKGRGHRKRGYVFARAFRNPVILREAGISEKKAEQIRTLLVETRKKMIPIHAKIRVNRISIRQEYRKRNVDGNKIQELLKANHELKWTLKSTLAQTRVRVTKILSYEQRTKLKEILRERYRGRRSIGRRKQGKFSRKRGRSRGSRY